MSKGIYISGKYAVSAAGWATDGEKECSANGFISAIYWLRDTCGMPVSDSRALWAQRDQELWEMGNQ